MYPVGYQVVYSLSNDCHSWLFWWYIRLWFVYDICAWFHLGASLWLQYCYIYLRFFHTQLLVSYIAFLISNNMNSVDIGVGNTLVLRLYKKCFSKYFAMIFDCFFSFEISPFFVLTIGFSLGANHLKIIFVVSFSFLSRSSKAYLILPFFHSWWCCEFESLSYFFLFLVISFFVRL